MILPIKQYSYKEMLEMFPSEKESNTTDLEIVHFTNAVDSKLLFEILEHN